MAICIVTLTKSHLRAFCTHEKVRLKRKFFSYIHLICIGV